MDSTTQIGFARRSRDRPFTLYYKSNTFFNALVSADKGYTPLNLSDNIISDIVKPNIPDTITTRTNNQKLIFRLLMHGLRNQIFTLRRRVLYLQYKIVL
jgi:hypothetical protein